MKKILASLFLLVFFVSAGSAQTESRIRKSGLGFGFIMNDFKTASRIRSTSLAAVMRDEKLFASDARNYGIAVTYIKGFTSHTDFAASLGWTFSTKMDLAGRSNSSSKDLVELDASGHFKMLAEGARFNPYLIAGVGVSKYTNVIGALIPLGGGVKLRVGDGVEFHSQFQYRIPVTTEANNYHFQISFGIISAL